MTPLESFSRMAVQLTAHKPALYPAEELDELTDIRISKLPVDGFPGACGPHAQAIKAGLHLFNESLYTSHSLAEQIHTPTGSYWHGIMHRMEGDYGNAKYWLRQAGSHPIHVHLADQIYTYLHMADMSLIGSSALRGKLDHFLAAGQFDPYSFTDLIEWQVTKARDAAAEELLRHMQWLEMKRLLDFSFAAIGAEGSLLA